MNHVAKKQGFTLIELMLAMSFVSLLLLAIAMTVIQVGNIYSRGMMLKDVNQTARDLSNDFSRSMGNSGYINPTTDFVQVTSSGLKVGGRLCLGTVSYIWNYGEARQINQPDLVRDANGTAIGLVKIVDPTRKYCSATSGSLPKNISVADQATMSQVLREGDRTMELYQFDLITTPTAIDTTTSQRLITIQYTIGSGNYTALTDDRTACKGPNEPGSDLQYCTVEQFSVTLRIGSGV